MHLHGLRGMALGTQASATAKPPAQLVKAAHEFEGQLLQQLLKPMTDSDGLTGDSLTGSAGALGSFASEALGQALSAQGGLGLADQIIRELTPAAKAGVSGPVSGSGTHSAAAEPQGVTKTDI
jgi:Rod binding domain-containing protein